MLRLGENTAIIYDDIKRGISPRLFRWYQFIITKTGET